jgi:hypothetical protein
MKLNILPLSQRDDRWKLKTLGTGSGTIGNYGCLLTCHSMLLTYFGHELLPDVLNEVYKSKGVFDQGNLINFWAAATCFDDIKVGEYYNCYNDPCDLSKIDNQLNKKMPVIAMVDFAPTAGVQTHFVLIIGKTEDNHYIINDPWTGETYYFDAKYGDPVKYIFGLRIYEGTPKDASTPQDQISDLSDKLKSCNVSLAEKALESNNLRDELMAQEKDNEDLASQLTTARAERDTANTEKKLIEVRNEGLISKVQSLEKEKETFEKGIETLQLEINALKIELKASEHLSISDVPSWDLFTIIIRRIFGKEV